MLTGELQSLLQAREIAKSCTHQQKKKLLGDVCDLVSQAGVNFQRTYSAEHLRSLNCMWALMERVAGLIPGTSPEPPLGGDTNPARFEEQQLKAA